ncbi:MULTISPECIES: 23S rRNA pseudouridine(1911/1915/1917) synthase RluD [unclassified Methylophilus]|uniref:23S rRNA pseudouridine(1911/1915/1917) synthase RluD n=1 Tax=unclassified Methylophilus TaxID=2630143 RepID=UPI0023B256FE|nr:23S rRNA pseudouridine(1911/1915/1917) synthase RluD [Methylophilus sp. YYY-1]MDF0377003.1 23S rRNA pseudouridine(1911/1915/1917) synthase RluD [Methylophilus sp. YYY-1]BEV08280.1 23S rRNA pseudouridine(1911/1915/1917) synthase RluD [Methylophilus sp. DW102]
MLFENMKESTSLQLVVPSNLGGQRLDLALQQMLPDHSRSRLQAWIKEGLVLLDGKAPTAKTKVWGGERLVVTPPKNAQDNAFEPEDIALDVVYEDDALIIINKPAGLVVHPAAGNWSGTLLNALLFHWPALKEVPRAGIVHRLDKDTSGLLVVAKTLEAQTSLVRQLQARTVKREYRAIVWGQLWRNGKVDQPIGRHPHHRTKMAVVRRGKPAITHYEILERFGTNTYLRCNLETGRTHQIRVHLQHLKAPMVGDPLYGIGNIIPHKMMTPELREVIGNFKRQALHAIKLGLIHPVTNAPMEWQIELADDMRELLDAMRTTDLPDEPLAPVDFNVDENGLFIGEDDEDWGDEDFDEDLDAELDEDAWDEEGEEDEA